MLKGLSAAEWADLMTSVKIHSRLRRRTPIEVSDLMAKASKHNSIDEIARAVEFKGSSMVHRFLALQRLDAGLRGFVNWGSTKSSIGFSAAAEIARLEKDTDRQLLAAASLEHQLTKDEVISVLQRTKRGGIGIPGALDEILKLRPVIERQKLYIGQCPELPASLSPKDLGDRVRLRLGQTLGAANVLAVNISNGRYGVLLTEAGVKDGDGRSIDHAKIRNTISACIAE